MVLVPKMGYHADHHFPEPKTHVSRRVPVSLGHRVQHEQREEEQGGTHTRRVKLIDQPCGWGII